MPPTSAFETKGNAYKLVPDRCKYELRRNFSHRISPTCNSRINNVSNALQ